jgi:hypothetical protein
MLGTTAYHDSTLGGDDPDDALVDEHEHYEEGGSGGFATVGTKWPQPGGLGSPVTITYSYYNLLDAQNLPTQGLLMPNGQRLPDWLIRGSIEEALGRWASVAPLHFVEVPDDHLAYGASTQYGQIRFRHIYINGPDPPPPAQPIAKAQAYYPSGSVLGGDVQFDYGDRWQEVGTLPQPDILGAAVHELGHSLGLAHTNLSQANMYWIFRRFSGLGTSALHPDDIAGIRSIYGTGVGSVTPLAASSIPEPATALLSAIVMLTLAGRRRRAA